MEITSENNEVFAASYKKIFTVFSAFVLILGIVFSFSFNKGSSPDLEGFLVGVAVGSMFGLFVLFFGLGQRASIDNEFIRYSSNLLSVVFPNLKKSIRLNEVKEVSLGLPKMNQRATFAAINIRSNDKEITFNPDLFNESTLHRLFLQLQKSNPSISFDNYSSNIIAGKGSEPVFRKTVLKNFGMIATFIVLVGVVGISLYSLGVLSKGGTFAFMGLMYFVLPFLYNYLRRGNKRS